MTTQKALVCFGPGEARVVIDRPIPAPRESFILVKTVAVALNPTDWKHIKVGVNDAIVGCDYSGIVEAVGEGVTKEFKKGDKVYGMVHGANRYRPDSGAFAEYIVAKGDIQSKIPDNLTFEEAATLGAGLLTVGQGMYQHLGLALPTDPIKDSTQILIYGGSTATGSLGIQFAKLSGYEPITVCSPRNFDFVKKLGAVAVFDYHDVDCGKKIREYTNNCLRLVWDTVSLPESAQICADALSTEADGKYYTLLPVKSARADIEPKLTLAYYCFGEPMQMQPDGPILAPDVETFEYSKRFIEMAEKLVADGKITPHPEHIGKHGLKGVLDGLQLMREGKVSGEKLVYRIEETP